VVWIVMRRGAEIGISAINLGKKEIKEGNKNKLLVLFREKGKISNDDVQKLLGIADATA